MTLHVRGRPAPTRVRGVVASGLAGLLMAGCGSGAVPVDPPSDLPADQQAACEGLVADLPDRLIGEDAREVSPDGALGAAWGDPALVLSCGVGMPDEYDDFAQCDIADGVAWFLPPSAATDQSVEVVATTIGYQPTVSLRVPAAYRPEGLAAALSSLAPALQEHLVQVDPCL